MKTKNFFLFLITLIVLSGCAGAKDALQGKKRSDGSDEFLIEKKNPLTKPPDYNELPVPISEENSYKFLIQMILVASERIRILDLPK